MPMLFAVMSSYITEPTALRESNKLATLDETTNNFDAIMLRP
jgi:hypothetical protein